MTDLAMLNTLGTMPGVSSVDVATLSNGDYLVAWQAAATGGGRSIDFQRFSASGTALTGVMHVPAPASSSNVDAPAIVPLPNGGFMIGSYFDNGARGYSYSVYSAANQLLSGPTLVGEPGWSYGQDNFAYANGYLLSLSHSEAGGTGGAGEGAWDVNVFLKDGSGTTVFTGKAATNNSGAQINGEVIPLSDGTSFLITWADKSGALDSSGYGLYARVFSTTTKTFTTNPFLINQLTTGSQAGWNGEVSTVSLPGGGFAAFWVNDVNAGVYNATIAAGEIKGRIFTLSGGTYQPAGNEFTVSQANAGNQNYISASQTPTGDILTVFSVVNDSGVTSIVAKVFDAAGNVIKPEFVLSTDADSKSLPDVTWLADGSAVAVWSRDNVATATAGDRTVVSQIIAASDLTANTLGTMPGVSSVDVATLSNGDYLVAWQAAATGGGRSIDFQRFSASGTALTGVMHVPAPASSSNVDAPAIVPLPNGGFMIGSYFDNGARGYSYSVYSAANQLLSGPTLVGEPGWSYGQDNFAYANGYLLSLSHSEAGGTGGAGEGAWDVNVFLKDGSGTTVFTGKAATNNSGAQINGEVIPLSDGTSFLITWADKSGALDSSGYGLYARVFSTTTKTFTTNPFLINQLTTGSQAGWNGEVSTVSLPGGGFAAFWVNDVNAGVYNATIAAGEIKGRIFTLSGGTYQPAGNEFTVSQANAGNQNYISASQTPTGDILTVFSVVNDSGVTSIVAKVFDAAGNVIKPEFVLSTDADSKSLPDVTWLADGSAVAVWSRDNVATATAGDRTVVSQIIAASDLTANQAPVITFKSGGASATATVAENTKAVAVVTATDVDANTTLSYSIFGGVDAALFDINSATGALSFKAAPNFEAPTDVGTNNVYDVVVRVSDGKLTDSQAIAVTVTNVNDAPAFSASSQSVSATAGTAKTITLAATDVDGDALTYTVATPSKGIATISGSTLTYTPTSSASGSDSFVVTVRDPSGATATQTINVTVAASTTTTSTSDFRVTASDGWTGAVGGNGLIYGTSGYQDIKVLSGTVTFDASFNKGGDIVRFDGAASSYTVARAGSSAQINAGTDLSAVIPIGTVGAVTSFSDGVRKLVYTNGNFTLGAQSFSTSAAAISSAADGTSLPTGASSSASARISLAGNDLRAGQTSHITIGGKAIIYGNAAKADVVGIASGVNVDLTFDASFNRGGDTIILDKSADSYSAIRSGTSIILTSTDQKLTIPVGTTSTTVKFADDSRALVYSTSEGAIKLGTQTIATTATAISSSSVTTSLDVGTSSSTTTVSGANGKVIFTDDATKSSYVKITTFGSDDIIRVTGATEDKYSFTNADLDDDGQADDLSITFSNPDAGIVNDIQIINAVSPTAFIADKATAISAVGFNFISFG